MNKFSSYVYLAPIPENPDLHQLAKLGKMRFELVIFNKNVFGHVLPVTSCLSIDCYYMTRNIKNAMSMVTLDHNMYACMYVCVRACAYVRACMQCMYV